MIRTARVRAEVVGIDGTAARTLTDPELASVNGGAIATRIGADETLIPEIPVYRVTLVPSDPDAPMRTLTGTALLEGQPASIAGQVWRRVVSVVIRESGF